MLTLPHTTIATGALYLAKSNLLRISSNISFCVTTINSQGWLLQAVGADMAAFNKRIIVSWSIGSAVN